MSPVGLGKPLAGRESLGSMLSESSTSDEERRRSGSNDRVSPERHDLTAVSVNYCTVVLVPAYVYSSAYIETLTP